MQEDTMSPSDRKNEGMAYKTLSLADVPHGRSGKHRAIVTRILKELNDLKVDSALKVPLASLLDSAENVRSALNRAARKSGRKIATAMDTEFLYIWNQSGKE
jgi:hypothetical protein